MIRWTIPQEKNAKIDAEFDFIFMAEKTEIQIKNIFQQKALQKKFETKNFQKKKYKKQTISDEVYTEKNSKKKKKKKRIKATLDLDTKKKIPV
ncbi:hypothetical protein RFI_03341 [Reticulomyxa filosa]|uniref:Uncharacterized protein n=1 Tax=Reticulomyxa filosa TaxID=46433 RepID=X6P6F4_RETFI|nr:hypothetical protein RFI_03341 [Reticulomyxa filosa]|eukprot:ETO33761.1 hypothetical protein RFI_03341 [Reticulomyxa filosa]